MPPRAELARLKGRPLRAGNQLFDAGDRRELDRCCAVIARSRGEEARALWTQGFALFTIQSRKLYFQDGFTNMAEWVVERLKYSYSWARVLIHLATTFTRDDVLNATYMKLRHGEEYARLARIDPTSTGWAKMPVFVPSPSGPHLQRLFGEATEPELERAVKHQRSLAKQREHEALPPEERAFYDELGRALDDVLRKHGHEGRGQLVARPSADGDRTKDRVELNLPRSLLGPVLKKLARLV